MLVIGLRIAAKWECCGQLSFVTALLCITYFIIYFCTNSFAIHFIIYCKLKMCAVRRKLRRRQLKKYRYILVLSN